MKRIALFGAGGRSERALLAEARSRGHRVTAAVRTPSQHVDLEDTGATLMAADATNHNDVRNVAAGHDVAVNAALPAGEIPADHLARINRALLSGLSAAGTHGLLVVGGAGTLEVAPGLQFVDTPEFPNTAKSRGIAHRVALEELQTLDTDIDWVYVTPPAKYVIDGPRTGSYRIGRNQLTIDEGGSSEISYADYAIGVIDEIESPKHHKERIMLAYS